MQWCSSANTESWYPMLVDVGCFSHTLDLVGEKFSIPHLSAFTVWWVSLFLTAQSPSCFGWREQEDQLKDTLQRDGGANLK